MLFDALRQALFSPKRWLVAGVLATIVLAIFLEGVARPVLGGPMKPATLICQVLGWDDSLLWLAEILHYGLGIVGFALPFAVLVGIVRPASTLLAGLAWGVVLWLAAGLVMAPLAGMPVLFGFTTVTLASLIAHLAYGAVLGAVYRPDESAHG